MNIFQEISQYIAIVTTVAIWILNQQANRRFELFKELFKRRLELFESLLPLLAEILDARYALTLDPENTEAREKLQTEVNALRQFGFKMDSYGSAEERNACNALLRAVSAEGPAFVENYRRLESLAVKKLRREIGLQ